MNIPIPDYRLPPGIEKGASGGPDFKTVIQESAAGQEQRIITWAKCRAKYEIGYSILNSSDPVGNYRVVLALFYGHYGKAYPFRFKAWSDYQANNEVLDDGSGTDGVKTQFQLVKRYEPQIILFGTQGPRFYYRPIVLPVASTVVIKINGTPTTAYTLGAGGIVTFDSAPATGTVLSWDGEFDIPVRFDVDHLPVIMNEAEIVQIGHIPLREVVGEF